MSFAMREEGRPHSSLSPVLRQKHATTPVAAVLMPKRLVGQTSDQTYCIAHSTLELSHDGRTGTASVCPPLLFLNAFVAAAGRAPEALSAAPAAAAPPAASRAAP